MQVLIIFMENYLNSIQVVIIQVNKLLFSPLIPDSNHMLPQTPAIAHDVLWLLWGKRAMNSGYELILPIHAWPNPIGLICPYIL